MHVALENETDTLELQRSPETERKPSDKRPVKALPLAPR